MNLTKVTKVTRVPKVSRITKVFDVFVLCDSLCASVTVLFNRLLAIQTLDTPNFFFLSIKT
jgi:hypothetical protein